MKILIFGAGNLLLTDEGFGVHFIRYLDAKFEFPENVELFDAGALGMMATHKLEEADRVYVVDVVDTAGEPGQCLRLNKEDLLLSRLPLKLSPHQIGVQEALVITELRGRCPRELFLLGVIPLSIDPGSELTPLLQKRLPEIAEELIAELAASGVRVKRKEAVPA